MFLLYVTVNHFSHVRTISCLPVLSQYLAGDKVKMQRSASSDSRTSDHSTSNLTLCHLAITLLNFKCTRPSCNISIFYKHAHADRFFYSLSSTICDKQSKCNILFGGSSQFWLTECFVSCRIISWVSNCFGCWKI